LVLLLFLVTGCSYVRPQQRLDFAPFAEHTISLAMDIEYGLTETTRSVNLRAYWSDPAIVAHRAEWEKVRALLKGVVAYSVEVTMLGNSTLSGKERCQALAEFLSPLARPVVVYGGDRLHLTPGKIDSILTDIRKQKKLLDGLNAAQPIIDEVARISDRIFDEVRISLDDTARALIQRIDTENEDVVLYEKLVREAQYRAFRSMVLGGEYRNGNTAVLKEFFENDPGLRRFVASEDTVTAIEMEAIEDRLMFKTEKIREFANQIRPDIDRYQAQQQELSDLYTDATHQLRRARVTMIVWARQHRNLAEGITDPAKVNLFDITKKAIDTAL
jgi:hypothetical protein